MNKKIIIGIMAISLIGLLLLSGCSSPPKSKIQQCCADLENLGSNVQEGQAGMPNPSSVFCNCVGGTSRVITSADGGQYSVCKVGLTEQEEWAYLRSKCPNSKWLW